MALSKPSGKKLMVVALVYVHPVKPTNPENHTMILLLRKRKPEWQRGKWNGPGGEVKEDESIADAASRELREETGLEIEPAKWDVVATMDGKAVTVVFVKYHYPRGEFAPVLSPMFEEDVPAGREFFAWFPTEDLSPVSCVYDLTWLVPFSLDGRFHAPIFAVRPEVEHDPKKPAVAPCIGGKETDTVSVPVDVKIGGKKIATGEATGHRNDLLPRHSKPTTVRPLPPVGDAGEYAASFPPFVPMCPPVVPCPLESSLPDTVLLTEFPTPEEVQAMKERIRAGEFDVPSYEESRKEAFPVEDRNPPSEPTQPDPPAEPCGDSCSSCSSSE